MHPFVGKSKGTWLAVNNLQRDSTSQYTHFPSIKQILRRYEQPYEFAEFPWHILRHIFLPQDHKTIKKTAKLILLFADNGSFMKTTTQGIRAFNFRRFRQPSRSCGIFLTANQCYGQNLTSTNVNEFVSGPISAVAIRENV